MSVCKDCNTFLNEADNWYPYYKTKHIYRCKSCDRNRKSAWNKKHPEYWKRYQGKYYSKDVGYREALIELLKERDGLICQLCETELAGIDEQVDHIIQRNQGGKFEAKNLRVVHGICNIRRPRKYE